MDDDIVARLREFAQYEDEYSATRDIHVEAADEITRLRADLAAARQEAKDAEHQMWIKALLKVLPEEKAVLFREICLARAALKGDGDE